ncbi:MAG: response regulator [Deltaproteobacteria bacterium]|jgi:twitching motility two-component system response regulator PilH|nr:response regulator [Deltaproteobacteria bacterium]
MSPEIKRKKILIVDDEFDMRTFLCKLLANYGFQPIGAGDRIEAMQIAKEQNPALIILDAMMPKESGILMYRQLKEDKNLKKVPVIMVSTIDKKTFSRYQKFQSGPYESGIPEPGAYLEMPLETEKLVRLVQQMTSTAAYDAI